MTSRPVILLLGLAVSGPAYAQSSPPDLQPRLVDRPLAGRAVEPSEKPKLQEPPRQPVTQNAPTPTATPAPASPGR